MFYVYVALYVYQIFTGILQVFFNFVIYMFLFLNYLILNLCGNIIYSLYIWCLNDIDKTVIKSNSSETYFLKRGTTWSDLERSETTYNEQETTWNNLEQVRSDMKRPTMSKKLPGAGKGKHLRKSGRQIVQRRRGLFQRHAKIDLIETIILKCCKK